MRKKILAGMLAALMAVGMLTGCSGRPDNAKNNSAADDSKKKTEKVELTVWAGAEDREYLKKVADNFIKEHSSEADISIIHKDMVEGECRSNLLGNVLKGADVYTTTDGDISAAADVIVIDYDPLTPMNESNINGHLMFGVNGSMVQTTVCNGKVLMKDREVLVCDEAKVMADCRQAAKELADDING